MESSEALLDYSLTIDMYIIILTLQLMSLILADVFLFIISLATREEIVVCTFQCVYS